MDIAKLQDKTHCGERSHPRLPCQGFDQLRIRRQARHRPQLLGQAPGPGTRRGPQGHQLRDARGDRGRKLLRSQPPFGVDFTRIAGFDALTVQTILSEVGLDPARFPSEKHFASWVALCPDNRVTGGAVKNTRTRKVVSRVATALRRAAQSVANSNTALGGFHRRMRARLGPAKAITATAHKLARIFYRMWKYRDTYHDLGLDYYESKHRERTLNSLRKRAATFGFQLVQLQPVSAEVS